MAPDTGDKAPDFTMATDGGGSVALKALKGKKVVLYFYPKDSTPGCTTQAIAFRDSKKAFDKLNTVIIGVSRDSITRHDNFKAKQELNFILASDEDGAVCEAYGVWIMKKLYGREYMGIERSTFLIDEKGVIRHVWRKVKVKAHAEEVLKTLETL
ncbi:MAG: thioredoxin-dependent thiol peroxidase [Rhodospirillales bacterium]|nr:thioredoxin-dependent thiol peroxidase [Rhodospirillales bacterium]MCW8863192.1 thioredoxin-dependent thiol peroxidase [Rhodospirillales bacterium]MCW8952201.1 thioredoxin-dependent thiol peroxidase [Rhodospirillales bacterium]MCW8970623.1 thioredoxin-dependent thiol peroxidase [Rhodospirillales bacterium]MCW9001121.1 thioredoxin-dependent thiol peroxidase [Rhodospirillales bacterium]